MGAAAPIIAIAISAIGTGVAAYGAYQQGQAAEDQAKYQEQVAKNNAIIAERQATDARERGHLSEAQQRLRTRMAIGSARASAASRGVLVDEGSALAQQGDIAAVGELDALTIRNNAEREALGFESQASTFTGEASLHQNSAGYAKQEQIYGTGATLLSGAASVADKWASYNPPVAPKE